MSNKFGGPWTAEKLNILNNYLQFYTKALKNQPFKLLYIDAFAGTGSCETKSSNHALDNNLFTKPCDQETTNFLDGSIKIALNIDHPFDDYIFFEKSPARYKVLTETVQPYKRKGLNITVKNAESNQYIKHLCRTVNWRDYRAVIFLDPFGMQVEWSTLEAIASTRAIDLWFLCPINAMNRMLPTNGCIDDSWRNRLNIVFGTDAWYNTFYERTKQMNLFGNEQGVNKVADYRSISDYVLDRLKTIFASVSNTPKMLYNSKGQPLFMLCFAVGNPAPKAIGLALKAANHILKN